jgi:MFS family permease
MPLHDGRFLTITAPFALGLTAQVGFLTHQVAYLSPLLGTVAAGWAVSLTTFAAVVGRLAMGAVVDRIDRRAAACANFLVQVIALGILIAASSAPILYLGCALFGLGVGNMISLPGLIVQQEFPKGDFTRVVSAVVAVNQFTFAFGPALLGLLRQAGGSYTTPLAVCLAMQALAATLVMVPRLCRVCSRS